MKKLLHKNENQLLARNHLKTIKKKWQKFMTAHRGRSCLLKPYMLFIRAAWLKGGGFKKFDFYFFKIAKPKKPLQKSNLSSWSESFYFIWSINESKLKVLFSARSHNQNRSARSSAAPSSRQSRHSSRQQERNRLLDPPIAAPRNNRHQVKLKLLYF